MVSSIYLFIYLFIYLTKVWRFQGSKPGGGEFSFPFQTDSGPIQPRIKWVPNLFPGDKGPGRGINHPPPSSAKDKERVEL